MTTQKRHWALTIFLIMVVCVSLLNVRSVHADGETPTEPTGPTQVETEQPTEPPAESTPEPVEPPSGPTEPPAESTPEPVEPVEAPATPLAEVLTQVPENTEVVVLDESGDSVPLVSQEAAEITEVVDPMWCPEGVLPGGAGCTANFPSINDLITDMGNNPASYAQNGVIYFTASPGAGTFDLSPTTLPGDFDTLKNYNLTLQGGWNGSTSSPTLSGQTNFGANPITIGSSSNPWIGNIRLKDIRVSGVSGGENAITIHTDSGDITLNNVDVQSQSGGGYVALLDTNSGDILVENGSTFQSAIVVNRGNGFSANSDTGSITISGVSGTNIVFNNFRAPGAPFYNGATLSAPTVSLSYVTASGNDGNGIAISNASLVTLDHVTSGPDVNNQGNSRSGVLINGTGSTLVQVTGGTFADNGRYGIEIYGGSFIVYGSPTCPTTGDTLNTLGCYNATPITDSIAPTLLLPADISVSAAGPAGAVVNYSASATDNLDPSVSVSCSPASGSTFPLGTTTVNCFATDLAGNTALGSFQVTVVNTPVVPPASPASMPGSPASQTAPSEFIIPVTGGEVIDLDCNSAFWAFGIRLSFMSLCDYQTTLNNVGSNNLPGTLPNGYTFVMGLDLSILSENQAIENLPDGTGIQMDFPILDGSSDQFSVLHWNGSEWIEVPPQTSDDENFYQVRTTGETGIFVLVKK
ncbi:MAG: HYR domain-containing protein [Anaerolineales bacterium]|nr:HYR domain-containing protein [Anaerolineales bacterium]